MSDDGPRVDSAIVWFEGYDRDSQFFGSAVGTGGFTTDDELVVRPAAVEVRSDDPEQGPALSARRVGIDVVRRCFVVELGDRGSKSRSRVLLNIDGAQAVLEIGRNAVGERSGGEQ